MRQYRGKVSAALWKHRQGTAKALLTALALLPLAAWTGHGTPPGAAHRRPAGVTGAIVSAVGDTCLSVQPNYPAPGITASVITGEGGCPDSSAQTWVLPGDNTIRRDGKCLATVAKTNGSGIVLATCDGSRRQFWEVDGVVEAAGLEIINPWSGKCMTDPGASTVGLTQVRVDTCNRSPAQTWYLPPRVPH